MLKLNNQDYEVCLLDTCIISDFLENPIVFQNFLAIQIKRNFVIAISISTILELKILTERYEWFKNEFTKLPTFLIKPANLLLTDEVNSYPNFNKEKFLFYFLFNNRHLLDHLDNAKGFQDAVKYIESEKENTLHSILNLKQNFPPNSNGKYSNSNIIEFIERVIIQQLVSFNPKWAKRNIEIKTFDFSKFQSLHSQLLITFWKFYLLIDRRPKKSDVFDISIVSALPYVDIFITEKNLKNDIDQIGKKGLLFSELQAITINQIDEIIK